MAFSHDGQYLLSVSRDRSWSLFEIDETSIYDLYFVKLSCHFYQLDFQARLYKRISSNNPYHKRIIWTCSFSHDDKYFATGARDQIIHVWRVKEKSNDDNEQPCEKNSLKLNDSVTAVTFASRLIDNERFVKYLLTFLSFINELFFRYFLVAGLDNGAIFLYAWNEQLSWQHLTSITPP
jgi:elongator complex protein 2